MIHIFTFNNNFKISYMKQVLGIMPTKGMSVGQSNEHLRRFSQKAWEEKITANFDPTRQKLNFEVTKGGVISPVDQSRSIGQRIKENLKSRNIKDPNEGLDKPNFRTVGNIILSGSTEQMRALAFGKQNVDFSHGADNSGIVREKDIENWAVDVYNFLADRFGEENIVAFVVHMDETAPHVHCTLVPVNDKGRISYNDVLGGPPAEARRKYLNLHDKLAEVNRKWNLERGDDMRATGARHISINEYKKILSHECSEVEGRVLDDQTSLRDLKAMLAQTRTKCRGLTTMVSNLEGRKAYIDAEIESLEEKIKNSDNPDELVEKLNTLQAERSRIIANLQDKKEKLQMAQREYDILSKRVGQLYMENLSQGSENTKTFSQVSETRRHMVDCAAFDHILDMYTEAREISEDSYDDSREKSFLDNSLLDLLVESGSEIAAGSVALFFGYLDSATAITAGGGGGGGGGGNWGRDDDDDDRWLRKCVRKAIGMAQYSPRKRGLRR